MVIQPIHARTFLLSNPEIPYSLSFAIRRVQTLLSGIDPAGGRYPLRAPHRHALHLAAAIETDLLAPTKDAETGDFLAEFAQECRVLHNIIIAEYVDYPLERGLPS